MAVTGAAAKPAWAADSAHSIDRVGLQLYTVREAMKTDFEGSIAKVAVRTGKAATMRRFAASDVQQKTGMRI